MIIINTEEGRYEYADTLAEASIHWDMLEANGYTPVEMTGDI
jgi:hypothetical protein